jgi:hypothetical protein
MEVIHVSQQLHSTTSRRLLRELPEHKQEDLARLRAMSLEEKARMLDAVCAAAADIEAAKLRMGMPPSKPAPWPDSTIQFLRKHAQNGRKSP